MPRDYDDFVEEPEAEEVDALVQFYSDYERSPDAADGLPIYHDVVMIRLDKPPYTSVTRVATEEDFARFRRQYSLYRRREEARKVTDGYPLALWPVLTSSEFQTLTQRGITTVEELARLDTGKGVNSKLPPPIRELAVRAKRMIDLQKEAGHFEEIIRDLEGQRDALQENLKEAHAIISAQNAALDRLRTSPIAPAAVN